MNQSSNNPLLSHFRQPKLFISLPSKGLFYPKGTLEHTENNTYPVYPMTARDEIMIKTPDALLNGQSTVSVIQNCMPNIKNAWMMPNIDLDAVLTAIRIATYGESLNMDMEIPGVGDRTFECNLTEVLDELNAAEYAPAFTYNEYTIETAPMNYKAFTDVAMKTFEEQRILQIVNDDEMSETEKLQRFNETFNRITEMNIASVHGSVVSITVGDEAVTNKQHIMEFLDNAPVDVYKAIINHVDEQRKKFTIKSRKIISSEEDRAAGAPEELEVPISFDASNFFA